MPYYSVFVIGSCISFCDDSCLLFIINTLKKSKAKPRGKNIKHEYQIYRKITHHLTLKYFKPFNKLCKYKKNILLVYLFPLLKTRKSYLLSEWKDVRPLSKCDQHDG